MKSSAFNAPAGNLGILVILAATTLLLTPALAEAQTEVSRARAEYRDSRQFYRISEFFTGRESTGSDVIVRSEPEERAGYYFTVRLKKYPYRHDTVDDAVQLEVIMPGDVEATLFTFPLGPAKKRNPLLLIGLTGEDWPDPAALPLAWRISFVDAEGTVLAERQSFLWSIEEE